MHTLLRSVLLLGAMTAAHCSATAAQSSPNKLETGPDVDPRMQIAFTGGAVRNNSITATSFWMTGGSAEVAGCFYDNWSVVADVSGMHNAQIGSTGVGVDLVTATFGPRYTWQPKREPGYSLFGHALVGEAFAFHTVIPTPRGVDDGDTSLALLLGGGMNIKVNHYFALRAFEANWLRTQLPNTTTNTQNGFRLTAGVVLRLP